jgi:hypothetical protein
MIINRAVLIIIFLFNYAFAEFNIIESSTLIQAEVTVEIQYDSQVNSSVILIISDTAYYITSVTSNSSITILSPNIILIVSGLSTTVV